MKRALFRTFVPVLFPLCLISFFLPGVSRAAGVGEELLQKGVRVEFAVTPINAGELVEGEYAKVSFRITDEATGNPVSSLNPGAWLDSTAEAKGGKGPGTCKERINIYLKGIVGMGPLLDLNSYYLLVLNREANISVIDPLVGITGKTSLLTSIPLRKPGGDWAKSGDYKRVYVTMPLAGQLAVIDTDTFKVTANLEAGANPLRVALQPDGKYLWIGNDAKDPGASGVTVIDTSGLRSVALIPTGMGHHEIVFSSDSRYAYVSNRDDGTVSVIDVQQMKKVRELKSGPLPISLAFSPLSRTLFIADGKEGVITVVEGKNHEVVARIKAKPGLGAMAVTPEGRWLLVTNGGANLVHAIDTSANRIIHDIQVEAQPFQITLTRAFAFVRCLASERVNVINLAELNKGAVPPVGSFAAGAAPPRDAGELGIASTIVPAVGEAAVFVVSPADKSIYYYMEGMNFPMQNFQTYGRSAVAVEVVDRSLREKEPGVYSTIIKTPAAGNYAVAFILDTPSIVHCFSVAVKANPSLKKKQAHPRIDYLVKERKVTVGDKLPLRFRLLDPETGEPRSGLKDVTVLYYATPGVARTEAPAREVAEGVYEAILSFPRGGAYFVYVASPSLKVKYMDLPFLSLVAAEGKAAPPAPPGAGGKGAAEGAE